MAEVVGQSGDLPSVFPGRCNSHENLSQFPVSLTSDEEFLQ